MLSVSGHVQPKTRQYLKLKHNRLWRILWQHQKPHPTILSIECQGRTAVGRYCIKNEFTVISFKNTCFAGMSLSNLPVDSFSAYMDSISSLPFQSPPPKKRPTANSAFRRFSNHTSIFVDFELRMWGTSWAKTSNINQLLLIAAFCNERFSRWSWPWLKAQDSVMKTHPANQWTNTTGT